VAASSPGGAWYHDANDLPPFAEAAVRPEFPGDPFRLFVYGTLMRGGSRHQALDGQRFLGEARTRPGYALLDLGEYPGLVERRHCGQPVRGELYEVAAGLVPRLDEIEGAPELFRLRPVALEGHSGPVYAYFYQRDGGGIPPCPGGRWDNARRRP
jgi:gamma-glutamylcyclotransferase (GGCT)/AIG2-like uncharacterized protein YtfP